MCVCIHVPAVRVCVCVFQFFQLCGCVLQHVRACVCVCARAFQLLRVSSPGLIPHVSSEPKIIIIITKLTKISSGFKP